MRISLTFFTTLLFLGSFAQPPIKIKQIESNVQVKIGYNAAKDYIWGVQIPFEFKVIFNANDSLWISDAFNYVAKEFSDIKDHKGWKGAPLYIKIGGKYVIQYSQKYLQQPNTCYYMVFARYSIAQNSDLQDSLYQYTKLTQDDNVTSVNVGTLREFKKKHPQIVKRILENDSIGFDVRRLPRKYIDMFVVPVEY